MHTLVRAQEVLPYASLSSSTTPHPSSCPVDSTHKDLEPSHISLCPLLLPSSASLVYESVSFNFDPVLTPSLTLLSGWVATTSVHQACKKFHPSHHESILHHPCWRLVGSPGFENSFVLLKLLQVSVSCMLSLKMSTV